ncbi:CcdC family protein [Salibacterium halotolerans]|uniref:Membrane protein CcdC involved in cytochrome C biogenesis n=1 Tax=Salibacterium halotolerans TaxID=1884432 RepID=A0A1I5UX01_9BACI|nr:cytochrome c biogenesis protein CcdC [Salibacterium halotolerans]SFP99739.1 Membrane protein CcdC involved in cytochrome C biogenesis [Salibacterium halotolerans]
MNAMLLLSTAGAAMVALAAIFIRMKAIKKPATVKKIILPPFFMSTGFLMFVYEPTRLAPAQILEAFSVGIMFSLLLMKTSRFEVRDNDIYMVRSKAFVFLLFTLLAVRIVFKLLIGDAINVEELAGMFFILAYGMIIPWRIFMLVQFKKVERKKRRQSSGQAPAHSH